MKLFEYIAIVYLGGALFMGIRLGWYMAVQLDRFDWHHSKSHNWAIFALTTGLWPIVILRPRNLVQPGHLFKETSGIAAGIADRDRRKWELARNPPLCGAQILFKATRRSDEEFGELIFDSDKTERTLIEKLHKSPKLADDDEGEILRWLRQRDTAIKFPTPVPELWSRFEYLADEMLRQGLGEIRCLKCEKNIPAVQLSEHNDQGKPGWNFNRWICPKGHQLFVVETIHILMTSKS